MNRSILIYPNDIFIIISINDMIIGYFQRLLLNLSVFICEQPCKHRLKFQRFSRKKTGAFAGFPLHFNVDDVDIILLHISLAADRRNFVSFFIHKQEAHGGLTCFSQRQDMDPFFIVRDLKKFISLLAVFLDSCYLYFCTFSLRILSTFLISFHPDLAIGISCKEGTVFLADEQAYAHILHAGKIVALTAHFDAVLTAGDLLAISHYNSFCLEPVSLRTIFSRYGKRRTILCAAYRFRIEILALAVFIINKDLPFNGNILIPFDDRINLSCQGQRCADIDSGIFRSAVAVSKVQLILKSVKPVILRVADLLPIIFFGILTRKIHLRNDIYAGSPGSFSFQNRKSVFIAFICANPGIIIVFCPEAELFCRYFKCGLFSLIRIINYLINLKLHLRKIQGLTDQRIGFQFLRLDHIIFLGNIHPDVYLTNLLISDKITDRNVRSTHFFLCLHMDRLTVIRHAHIQKLLVKICPFRIEGHLNGIIFYIFILVSALLQIVPVVMNGSRNILLVPRLHMPGCAIVEIYVVVFPFYHDSSLPFAADLIVFVFCVVIRERQFRSSGLDTSLLIYRINVIISFLIRYENSAFIHITTKHAIGIVHGNTGNLNRYTCSFGMSDIPYINPAFSVNVIAPVRQEYAVARKGILKIAFCRRQTNICLCGSDLIFLYHNLRFYMNPAAILREISRRNQCNLIVVLIIIVNGGNVSFFTVTVLGHNPLCIIFRKTI